MTRQDVTWVLELIKNRDARTDAERDAIDMAIEALQDRPVTWAKYFHESECSFCRKMGIDKERDCQECWYSINGGEKPIWYGEYVCSNCGNIISTMDVHWTGIPHFCSNCGADMRGDVDGNRD